MTNPITEPTQSIRDRCIAKAREAYRATECSECAFDAILAELQEPSGDACIAGARTQNHFTDNSAFVVFRAMIQHIRSGGK